jgi:hypothetical protein
VAVVKKAYASEGDLFADAIRLNVGHGDPLDAFTLKRAILRLQKYGYEREVISEIVRLPATRIETIERGFASSQDGKPLALKGGLRHLHGHALSPAQQEVNRRYSGGQATFHLRQLCGLIENNMWPRTENFAFEMNRLVGLWAAVARQAAEKTGTG